VFVSLDPWEGSIERAVSLNGYNWVEGNPTRFVDPTGAFNKDAVGKTTHYSCNCGWIDETHVNWRLALNIIESLAYALTSDILATGQ
jgi:hypothetical protein